MLRELTFEIPAGQRVLVAGPSGAGKSTLLRALAGLLLSAGSGELSGRVLLDGRPVTEQPGRVGLLLQDPLASVVAETVGRDVAFGLENAQVPRAEIWQRVSAALQQVAFPYGTAHPTSALSGGETQRLALASHLVLASSVTLLDEPTAMLDPASAALVRAAVRRDAVDRGTTTIIVEHHLEPWLGFADRLIVLGADGTVVADGDPAEVLAIQGESLAAQGVWVPDAGVPEPLSIDPSLVEPWETIPGVLVSAEDVSVELRNRLGGQRRSSMALDGVSAMLESGSALAVTGASGAGKSTLVTVLAGLLRPTAGRVLAAEGLDTRRGREPWRWSSTELVSRLAWVPQLPEHGIVATTVLDEVLASSRVCRTDQVRARQRADATLELLGLGPLAGASPYHLSGGEQRRLMVAASLVHGPAGLLLDEPTVGQDRATWSAVTGCMSAARAAGCAVAFASHDMAAVEALGDTRLMLQSGRAAA